LIGQRVYEGVLVSIFLSGIVSFVVLFFVSAPYGRHFRHGWGVSWPARRAWVIMEQPAFWIPLLFFLLHKTWADPVRSTFLLLWEIHYFQRTFLYPFLLPETGKPFPRVLVFLGMLFNTLNGCAVGYGLLRGGTPYPPDWFSSPAFLCGTFLFLAGFAVNLCSDAVLRTLKAAGAGEYRIPRSGLYRFVSCPNYLGEITEWAGFAVLTWSLPGTAFAFFTFCNLAPRALTSHRWYRETFSDYPARRKALIPFLW
jgi:3-oxo-5-alpha-steroid 4-dehydrogenase 1